MTREEAKKAAEVMLAYADGKEIEQKWDGQWVKNKKPKFNWGFDNYRIKPEPKYRPFKDAEECWNEMQKHQPFGWICEGGEKMFVVNVNYEGIIDGRDDGWVFSEAFSRYTFADGEPFGVKEDK